MLQYVARIGMAVSLGRAEIERVGYKGMRIAWLD